MLVVCGEEDAANAKASAWLAEQIGTAEFQFVPDASHEVNIDTPAELARIINAFHARVIR